MPRTARSRRGRAPSILTVARQSRDLRRQLKALVRAVAQMEQKLTALDRYYRSRVSMRGPRLAIRPVGSGLRGRGPNVRDVAFEVLSRSRAPMNIARLAAIVIRRKGGEPGENFTQNLGAALYRDRRFKRTGRGLYGLR